MRLTLTALTLFCALARAQDPARDDRWRADLDALSAHIIAVHPDPYTRISQDSFQQQVQRMRDQIPALSDRQVVLGTSRILAMVNDGLSSINLARAGTGIRRYSVAYRGVPRDSSLPLPRKPAARDFSPAAEKVG